MKICDFCGERKYTRRRKVKCTFTPVSRNESEKNARWGWKTVNGRRGKYRYYNNPKKDMYFIFNICDTDLRFCHNWIYHDVKNYKRVMGVKNHVKENYSEITTDN